ncbi:beta-D-glucosyl crocetin beta-1,6-glucosyltransferase-like [Sesamum indicum]|uniref:Glycosyltransferase n=1 Tax=Sesamum indicum TaxID=4182 RepID=A0A6I9T4I3_SESIN|nr:beta-D-glucosyl crocetin beta-1,6-glucosyltransferase-like [Sesamum indicum]
MDANKNQSIQVLMFPWLAYGHITPYLELAKKLTSRGFNISLCSTPATLCCVDKKITNKLSQSIKLVPLFLPPLPGLPPELHTTNGLPPHVMPSLKEAFDLSINDFSNILKQLKPHMLIYDFLQPWAPVVAKEQKIPAVEFVTSSSTMSSFMFHYFRKPWIEFPFPNIYFRDYEYSNMKKLLRCASDPRERDKASEGVERSCKIVLIKGFRDIEGKYIDYVTSLVGKKFVPVGPLVQEPSPDEKDDESLCTFSWLDMKERKSTVFVSFGSEYFLTKEDIDEIAYGLELSKINFIWVLRFPKGANGHNGLLGKTLPRGVLERVGDRGKILEGWAPQTKILGHESIGGFVSHCGWNSVIESMNFGVPIIAVPMHLDQPINARLVEEVGVGVEVVRDRNKRLSRGRLAAVIKQVVMEDCGEVVRQRAAEMREKLKSKGDQEIDEVVKELVIVCNNS